MNIAARIEKKRLALLAIIAPWFAFVLFYWGRGEKPLPPRLGAFALETVAKMEKAAGYLLIASVYSALSIPKRTAELESMAFCLARSRARLGQSRVSIAALHARLFAIWRFVTNLQLTGRNLARNLHVQQFLRALGILSGQSTRGSLAGTWRASNLPDHRDKTGPP